MSDRFTNLRATPPGGWYEYALPRAPDAVARDTMKSGICAKVREMRAAAGLETVGDGFQYVMDYMCPRLPDGFCSKPSSVPDVGVDRVKSRTAALFSLPQAVAEEVERRLSLCIGCPRHVTRGFCMTCTGFLDWIYAGFRGRRPRLPPDLATGACSCDAAFTAATATVASFPLAEGADYPARCWRPQTRRGAPL